MAVATEQVCACGSSFALQTDIEGERAWELLVAELRRWARRHRACGPQVPEERRGLGFVAALGRGYSGGEVPEEYEGDDDD